ncbi:hypothetical protein QFC22_001317 [Naganishia vaughanmartiniae]|uniref:Uncharacterized protein n=1 Tax=Naganishia vaughanmartiniae TaxID=1424756 RepID=A0ACC2XHM0_9TREE|nr:hypothetical protein QFC22_001317 [Naganishia vaughanmartiniae]
MVTSPQHSPNPHLPTQYTFHDTNSLLVKNSDANNDIPKKRLISQKSLSSLKYTTSPFPNQSSMSSLSPDETGSTSKSRSGKKIRQFLQKIGKKHGIQNGSTTTTALKEHEPVNRDEQKAILQQPLRREHSYNVEGDTSLTSVQSWGPGPTFSPDPVAGIRLLDQAEHEYNEQSSVARTGEISGDYQQRTSSQSPESKVHQFVPSSPYGELDQIQEEQGSDRNHEAQISSSSGSPVESSTFDTATAIAGTSGNDTAESSHLPLTPISSGNRPSPGVQSGKQSLGISEQPPGEVIDNQTQTRYLPTSPKSNTTAASDPPVVASPSSIGPGAPDQAPKTSYFGRESTPSERLNSHSISTDQASLTSGSFAGHYTVHHQTSSNANAGHLYSDRPAIPERQKSTNIPPVPTHNPASLKARLFTSFTSAGKQHQAASAEEFVADSSEGLRKTAKAEKFRTLGRLGHPGNTSSKTQRYPTAPALFISTEENAAHPSAQTYTYAPPPITLEPLRVSPTQEKTSFAQRLIRRVASAPNTKGLFTSSGGTLSGSGFFSVASGTSTQVNTPPAMTPTDYPSSSSNTSSAQLKMPNLSNLIITDSPEGDQQLSESPQIGTLEPLSKPSSPFSPKYAPSQGSSFRSPVMSNAYLGGSTSTLGSTSTGAPMSGRGIGSMGAREGRASSVGVLQQPGSSGNFLGINGVPIGNGKPIRPNALTAEQGKGSFRRTYSSNSIRTKTVEVQPSSFQKVKLLGKGDVGKVYLVREKKTDKLYAMKVLSKKEMIKRNKIKRALAEQEILATSNHPFIVTLYHSFQSDDYLYFCMDILLHESGHIMLSDFDLSKPTSEHGGAPAVMKQSAQGGKLFGRLPHELFRGNGRSVQSTGMFTLSRSRPVVTTEYISPEVIKGNGHTFAVDFWCLGILIYEMIFATTPFKGANRVATFANVLKHDVTFPDSPHVTSHCKSLVRKLLIKDEHKRLGSASGASEVKHHKWFAPINWGLLRHQTPPICPQASNGIDTVNFRNMRDSKSLDFDKHETVQTLQGQAGSPSAADPGTPGILTPRELVVDGAPEPNPFHQFTSVTREFDE